MPKQKHRSPYQNQKQTEEEKENTAKVSFESEKNFSELNNSQKKEIEELISNTDLMVRGKEKTITNIKKRNFRIDFKSYSPDSGQFEIQNNSPNSRTAAKVAIDGSIIDYDVVKAALRFCLHTGRSLSLKHNASLKDVQTFIQKNTPIQSL